MGAIKNYLFRDSPALIWAPQARQLCTEDTSTLEAEFPLPSFTFAHRQPDGGTLPQIIAHRGDKAREPENSMRAFRSAVAAGAHALETDTHVTRDGIVVLSHDANLKRCFGRDVNLIECDWEEVKKLKSTREPHEPMPSLAELLQYLAEPGMEDVWVLLDIKVDVDPNIMIELIASTIASVEPSPHKPWNTRVLLGVWGTKYLPLIKTHLPTYSVTNIGFSTIYARFFFRHAYCSFNTLAVVLSLWPVGAQFIRSAHKRNRSVIAWTVNDQRLMRWSVAQGLDGVITDDPSGLVQVMEEWRMGKNRDASLGVRNTARALWFNALAFFFVVLLMQWRLRDRWDGGKGRVSSWRYKQLSGKGGDKMPRLT